MLRIAEFEPLGSASGALYRPRVYADTTDGGWHGYIVFFPVGAGTVISTPRETTQPTFEELQRWSLSLDSVYLEGALARARGATAGVALPATVTELDLAAAETRAAGDAIALHHAADLAAAEAVAELDSAEMHEEAAAAAHANAERLLRKRAELDELARQTSHDAAEAEAEGHEAAARDARAVAADASRAKTPKAKRARRKRPSSRTKSS